MNEWQPIETAPRDGTAILGFWPTSSGDVIARCYGVTRFGDGAWLSIEDEEASFIGPDYWMPLPAPPAALASRPQEETK